MSHMSRTGMSTFHSEVMGMLGGRSSPKAQSQRTVGGECRVACVSSPGCAALFYLSVLLFPFFLFLFSEMACLRLSPETSRYSRRHK